METVILNAARKELEKEKQSEALERLKEMAKKYEGDDKIISSLDIAKEMAAPGDQYKILTGWGGLDNIIKGFRLGQVVVVTAMTKSGKTSWCIDLTSRIKEENPLWFPFEEGAEELITKFVERGEDPPLFYLPKQNTHFNIQWLEQKIIESIAKNDTKIVFIDHLDFIVPFQTDRNDLMIAKTMRDLKSIATRWGIVIVLLAHVSQTEMDKQPTMRDLRGSASIGQEADTVIVLWRQMTKKKNQVVITNNVNVSVQANRRIGKTGNVQMVFDEGHFIEKVWIEDPEQSKKAQDEFEKW